MNQKETKVTAWQDLQVSTYDDQYDIVELLEEIRGHIWRLRKAGRPTFEVDWVIDGGAQVSGRQFTKATKQAIRDLTGNELKVYLNTLYHQHQSNRWCMTSIQTKVKETKLGERTVYRLLKKMVEEGKLRKLATKPYLSKNGKWVQLPHWYKATPASEWK